MENRQGQDVIIRQIENTGLEELFRLTIFKKLESTEELLLFPDVALLIANRAVRLERIDNFRFNLFIQKLDGSPARKR